MFIWKTFYTILYLIRCHFVTAMFIPPTLLPISCFPAFLQKAPFSWPVREVGTDAKAGSSQQEVLMPHLADVVSASLKTLALCCPLLVEVSFPSRPFSSQTHLGMPDLTVQNRDQTSLKSQTTSPGYWLSYVFGLWFSSGRLSGVLSLRCSLASPSSLASASFSQR